MKHVTIKDVARQLNVSISTVSRAFNDKYDIRKDTRERILKVAREMGYRPNPIARKLIQQKTFNIGVVVPEFVNSYFPEVIIGIQEVLIEKGYQVLVMQSNECYTTELKNIQTLEDNMVDGMIISLSSEKHNNDYYLQMLEKGYPIVFFNRVDEKIPASRVTFDDYKWAYFATEHLIKQGYQKIFHFSGYQHLSLSQNRIKGFRKAMDKFSIPYTKEHIIETGFFIEEGRQVMERLIAENNLPDAIFANNDPTAIGAMKAMKQAGLRIPEDVALVGFSESKLAEVVEPPLTSVSQPTFEIGKTAANLLLKQINADGFAAAETVVLNGTLNIRASSLAPVTQD
uniref:LacI family DNA-binding transcriptional regulator n=1 Tax=Roseihalotalea indica TaxID=2867963 RepID=A0AA49GRY6_9BACT|nr:LacI family DNA-binding transcriptional regulator [Tunicatimonas sp. TK19036]